MHQREKENFSTSPRVPFSPSGLTPLLRKEKTLDSRHAVHTHHARSRSLSEGSNAKRSKTKIGSNRSGKAVFGVTSLAVTDREILEGLCCFDHKLHENLLSVRFASIYTTKQKIPKKDFRETAFWFVFASLSDHPSSLSSRLAPLSNNCTLRNQMGRIFHSQ